MYSMTIMLTIKPEHFVVWGSLIALKKLEEANTMF